MSTLQQRRVVHCPYHRAKLFMEDLFGELAEKGQTKTVPLRVPLGSNGGPALQKDVEMTARIGADPMHFDEPWNVHWTPSGGGPYPEFGGTLTVRGDETYETCLLELSGEYVPPLGTAGAAFDSIVGNRIAAATAREFLQELGDELESRYRLEESEKAAPPP